MLHLLFSGFNENVGRFMGRLLSGARETFLRHTMVYFSHVVKVVEDNRASNNVNQKNESGTKQAEVVSQGRAIVARDIAA